MGITKFQINSILQPLKSGYPYFQYCCIRPGMSVYLNEISLIFLPWYEFMQLVYGVVWYSIQGIFQPFERFNLV